MQESRFVKTKIVAGYLLLVAAALLAVGYVYRETVRVAAPDDSYTLLHLKRNMAGETLYHLYRAESYGQFMIAGYNSFDSRYRNEIGTVRRCLDSLRRLSPDADSLQRMRLDSIGRLLTDKERRTAALRRSIRSGGTASLLDANVEGLLARLDSLSAADSLAMRPSEPVRSVISQDTVATPRRKRRFFRRIADIFSPPKEDSTLVISRREVIDSLPAAGSLRDTIGAVLRALQDKVTSQRLAIYDKAWDEGVRLRSNNELVNEKIYRLIRDFEQEETAYLLDRIDRNEALRKRNTRLLGGIALTAVALMLLFVAILWRDINRSNRYKRALERANRDKAALLDAREKLMLAVTHDIKAPLGAIMGYTELLGRITDDERERHYLDNIARSSEHLRALTENLLDFYKLDIHKVELNEVRFVPERLFEAIRAGFAAQAAAKGLVLTLRTTPECRREVTGDASRIRQVADNLLSNAVKFTDSGGIDIELARDGAQLRFAVRDTGRGIGAGEQERIFREFERCRSARGVEGFGLGLSIVDRLVKLLGGEIALESRPGAGSRFTVTLPVKEAPAEGKVPAAAEESPSRRRLEGVALLAVDDDPLQLEMTAAQCRRAGIRIACCQYPEYAARLAAAERFDVVLTDIQMPSADGFRVRAEVDRAVPGLPVIAVTARSETEPLRRAGFAAVLHKPFTGAELCAALAAVLHRDGAGPVTERNDAGGSRTDGNGTAGAERTERAAGGIRKEEDRTADKDPAAERARTRNESRTDGNGTAGAERTEQAAGGIRKEEDRTADKDPAAEQGKPAAERPDFGRLTAFAGDDPEAAREILSSFVEQHTASLETMRRALAEGDTATLRATAHRMLPLFTMLGADAVTAPLRRIERLEGDLSPQAAEETARACEFARQIVDFARKEVSLPPAQQPNAPTDERTDE